MARSAVRSEVKVRAGWRSSSRRKRCSAEAGERGSGSSPGEAGSSLEEQLQQEIQRRGLSESEQLSQTSSAEPDETAEPPAKEESEVPPSPRWAGTRSQAVPGGQLERSRELNAEGIAGFPSRALELIKLGFTSTAYFLPISIVVGSAALLLYAFAGSGVLHGGESQPRQPAAYDPRALLTEETYDRTVPVEPRR